VAVTAGPSLAVCCWSEEALQLNAPVMDREDRPVAARVINDLSVTMATLNQVL
jgi:hypothetical protein